MANNSIDVRISQMVTAEVKRAVKEEMVIGRKLDKEIIRSTKLDESYGNRLDSLENKVGNNKVTNAIEGYIVSNLNTTGNKVPTASSVKAAIDAITFTNVSNNNKYVNQLYTLKDKNGNVLMYFDENGNLHVNGAVICTNM